MIVGKHTYGHNNIRTFSWGEGSKLEIGSFCSIAADVKIFLGGNHRVDWVTTYPFGHRLESLFNKFNGNGHPYSNGDVIIGNDVWIGSSVTIMSGVIVGDGAVIANNSHVVKNVNPYTIVGGNPAKVIKQRFTSDIIDKLLKLKWWEMNDNVINEISPILCSSNLDELFKYFNIKDEKNN
jgi:acetyltransferase-like isoleucine patch superfamily enzyme